MIDHTNVHKEIKYVLMYVYKLYALLLFSKMNFS